MDVRTGDNKRESWWVKNLTNKTITIGDLLLVPAIKPGKKVDLLHHYTREKISHSTVLVQLVKTGVVSLNKKKLVPNSFVGQVSIGDIDDAITPAEENEIGGGTSDHGDLNGLLDDDHILYLLIDGTRAMTGTLDVGVNDISNVVNLTTTGNININSDSSKLFLGANQDGSIYFDGTDLNISLDNPSVGGIIKLNDYVFIKGNLDLNNNLDVAGDTVLSSDLNVDGVTFTVNSVTKKIGMNTDSPAGPLEIVSEENNVYPFYLTSFGDGQIPTPGFVGRGARGTKASPSPTLAGDPIFLAAGRGYYTGAWENSSPVIIQMHAAEDHTNIAQGTYIVFKTTEIGSTGNVERLRIKDDGTTRITGLSEVITPAGFNRAVRLGPFNLTNGNGGYIEFATSSSDGYGPQIGGIREGGGAGYLTFRTGTNSQVERMRIADNGDIDISEKLEVNGNININSNSSKLFLGESQDGSIFFDGTDLNISLDNPSVGGIIKINDDVEIAGKTIVQTIDTDAGLTDFLVVDGSGEIHKRTRVVSGAVSLVVAASNASSKAKANADYLCDGTDDEVQIQAAMDAGNGSVFLSPGNYAIAAGLTIPSNITLYGAGNSTILDVVDGVEFTVITNSNTTPGSRDATGNTNIIIRDMYINGNNNNLTASGGNRDFIWCVGFSTVDTLLIENLTVVKGMTAGIRLEFCTNVVITGNTVKNSADDGIAVNNNSIYVSVNNNYVVDVSRDMTFTFNTGSGGTAWAAGHVLTSDTTYDPGGGSSNFSKCIIKSITIDGGTSFGANDATGTVTVVPASATGEFTASDTLTSDTGGATGVIDDSTPSYGAPFGIEIQDASENVTIYGNRVRNCGAGAFRVNTHTGEGTVKNVTMSNNVMERNIVGFAVAGLDSGSDIMSDIAICNNVISDDYYVKNAIAITTAYTRNLLVQGNIIKTTGDGLKTSTWTEQMNIIGNSFTNTTASDTKQGLIFAGAIKHSIIRDNAFLDYNYKGIALGTSQSLWGLQITNNTIVGCDRPGRCIDFGNPTDSSVVAFTDGAGGNDSLTIATNLTDRFYVGSDFTITDATSNDGTYRVLAVSYGSPNTTIEVATGSWVDTNLGTAYIETTARSCVLAGNYFEGTYWSYDVRATTYDQLPAAGGWAATYPNIDDTP